MGVEAIPRAAAFAGATLAADSSPVENHKIADLHVGDGIPDGFDDSGGLVAEEEGKFVDPAFSIGQVSVTNAAGLDSHHNIARVGIGQNHSGEFNGSMGLARNDTTNGLRHRLLSDGITCGQNNIGVWTALRRCREA